MMRPEVTRWLRHRTFIGATWAAEDLVGLKRGTSVAVVLPALNEEATVGEIVAAIRRELVDRHPVVDDLVVIDSGSDDRTSDVAQEAGARVVHRDEVLPRLPAEPGKGEVLWRSLLATDADVLVFIDADLQQFSPAMVTGLLGPIFSDRSISLVKGMYDRPLASGDTVHPAGGGRVTELVARPVINLHWPQLAGVVQPLGGEYAARRDLLEQLPFPCGYGVELAVLIDSLALVGLDGLAQVDLGERRHRHQDDAALGRMASEIWQAAWVRLQRDGRVRTLTPPYRWLTQFRRSGDRFSPSHHDVAPKERPPMVTVPEYVERRRGAAAATA